MQNQINILKPRIQLDQNVTIPYENFNIVFLLPSSFHLQLL